MQICREAIMDLTM